MNKVVRKTNIQTDPVTSKRMSSVRRSDTKCEKTIRALLYKEGVRFRKNVSSLPGSPDICNKSRKWAIFVHGCFWHGHLNCKKAKPPKRNTEFWITKINRNRDRDKAKTKELEQMGYLVITVWECQLSDLVLLKSSLLEMLKDRIG